MASIVEALLSEVLKTDTLTQVAEKVGISSENVSEIVSTAIPTLLGAMSENSKTEDGAASLAKALEQHFSATKVDVTDAVVNADTKDGNGIIKHILGSNLTDTVSSISKDSKVDAKTVQTVISMVAPILLTFVASAKKKSNTEATSTDMSSLVSGLVTAALASKLTSSSSTNTATDLITGVLKGILSK